MANEMDFEHANYCTDKNLMKQRALHETLSRLLWRYSMEHDGDKIDWDSPAQKKYLPYYDLHANKYCVDCTTWRKYHSAYFHTYEAAENAINDIIKPFMAEHLDFI